MKRLMGIMQWPKQGRGRGLRRLASQLLRDQRGGEVLEYALVAGLIVVGAIGMIACVGTKIVAKWNSINSQI